MTTKLTEMNLRKLDAQELEDLNIKLGNESDEAVAKIKAERQKVNAELDRRARVDRGEEADDTPVKDS